MPPCPTSTRISYCPRVARRSAASCASDASGRASTMAPGGVATVGPDHGRCTAIPVPQRGQKDAPGPRLAPQRKQEEGGFGLMPTGQDTAILTPCAAKAPSCAPWYHATGSAAGGGQFQAAHHVERPLGRHGELRRSEHRVPHILIVPRETRPQRRHCSRCVGRDEFAVLLRGFRVPVRLVG